MNEEICMSSGMRHADGCNRSGVATEIAHASGHDGESVDADEEEEEMLEIITEAHHPKHQSAPNQRDLGFKA